MRQLSGRAGATAGVAIYRANLMHTLVVFEGVLDMTLKWVNQPWNNAGCRARDAVDLRVLELSGVYET